MNFRALTWPQVVLLLGGFGLVVAAYKLLGPEAAGALTFVLHGLAASSTPKDPPTPPGAPSGLPAPAPNDAKPASGVPFAALVLALVGGCAAVAGPAKDITQIEACQTEGRIVRAADGGVDASWQAYDDCMRRNGYDRTDAAPADTGARDAGGE